MSSQASSTITQIERADSSVLLEKRAVLESGNLDAAIFAYEDGVSKYPADPELNFGYSFIVFFRYSIRY